MLFSTNVGDYVIADQEHPIVMRGERPLYSGRLEARIQRSVFTVWWKRVNSEATTCGSSAMAARSTRLGDRLKRCLQNFAYKIARRGKRQKKAPDGWRFVYEVASLHVRVVGSTGTLNCKCVL